MRHDALQAHLPFLFESKFCSEPSKHLEYSTDTIGLVSDSNSFNVDTNQSTFRGSNAGMDPPLLKQSLIKNKKQLKIKDKHKKQKFKINLGKLSPKSSFTHIISLGNFKIFGNTEESTCESSMCSNTEKQSAASEAINNNSNSNF